MRGKRVAEKILAVSLTAVLVLGMLPAAIFGSLELAFPVKAHAASSGTWHGVSYDIDDSGCVTFHAGTMTGNFEKDDPFNAHEGFKDVTAVRADGTVVLPANSRMMFYECTNLESIDMTGFDSSNTTDMTGMFQCGIWVNGTQSFTTSLISLDISQLDTENVSDMRDMFLGCAKLKQLDLSSFRTSNVTDMAGLFEGCMTLKSLDISGFDLSHVKQGRMMFSQCSSLTSLDLSGLDWPQLEDAGYMFEYCSKLINVRFPSTKLSKLKYADGMFSECYSLRHLDLRALGFPNVERMDSMFWDCASLESVDFPNNKMAGVKRLEDMFAFCTSLVKVDLSSMDTTSVLDMGGMFSTCSSLTRLDLSNFCTPQVRIMQCMFYSCKSLSYLNISHFNTSAVVDMRSFLEDCDSLNTIAIGGDFSFYDTHSSRYKDSSFPTGYWKSSADGGTYKADSIPSNVAAIYTFAGSTVINALSKGKTVSLAENIDGKNVTVRVKAVKGGVDKKSRTVHVALRKVVVSKKKTLSAMARKKNYKTSGKLPKTFAIPEPRWHAELRYTIVYAQIGPKGFWKTKNVKTVVAPSTITKIGKRAFGKSSVRTLRLRTRLLSKKRVKSCLQQSKMKTVQVRIAKKWQKKTKKTYKKAFARKNSGRKVKVA